MTSSKKHSSQLACMLGVCSLVMLPPAYAATSVEASVMPAPLEASVTEEPSEAEILLAKGRREFSKDNMFEALPYIQQSADLGLAEAKGFLAYIIYNSGLTEDAIVLYKDAAEHKDLFASFKLSEFYLVGRHVEQDTARGMALLDFAQSNDYTPALLALGALYEEGKNGVIKDEDKAFGFYQRAGLAGDSNAIGKMLKVYRNGLLGIQADPERLAFWELKLEQQLALQKLDNSK